MYRPPSLSSPSGSSVSSDGYDGAETLFDKLKSLAGELGLPFLPTAAEQSASARAAVDAYMAARNGITTPGEAFFGKGTVPAEFPRVELKADVSSPLKEAGDLPANLARAATELLAQMSDMINQAVAAPVGALGQLLGFLFKVFSEIAQDISEVLGKAANAMASVVENAWQKRLQLASAAGQTGLQPLELCNQSGLPAAGTSSGSSS